MSQTKAQLINAVDGSIVDADIVGLTSSKLSGALPAVSAANLTNIPAANLTGTLPAISGANLTGISAGITMADQWRITTTFQVSSTAFITSNWERNDTTGYGKIGTGMSESSGEFSFPSTGIYLVRIVITWYADGGGVNSNRVAIHTTTDNSNYSSATYVFSGVESGNQYNNMTTEIFFDVTDVSTHKVKFEMSGSNTRPRVEGSSNDNRSFATFIRLGDT
tara:strand:+ start:1407 stop:2069 length:663 start_codon:yes stop_codon:yes gene_type:complete